MGAILLGERIFHPETLRVDYPGGAYELLRVDHPVAHPIRDGEPTLGWGGDPALQLYLDAVAKRWILVRFEDDAAYRITAVAPEGAQLNPEFVNKAISRLVATDVRRGFKPKEAVDAHNAAIDQAKDDAQGDYVENDFAPKLAWALKRDGADNYV